MVLATPKSWLGPKRVETRAGNLELAREKTQLRCLIPSLRAVLLSQGSGMAGRSNLLRTLALCKVNVLKWSMSRELYPPDTIDSFDLFHESGSLGHAWTTCVLVVSGRFREQVMRNGLREKRQIYPQPSGWHFTELFAVSKEPIMRPLALSSMPQILKMTRHPATV